MVQEETYLQESIFIACTMPFLANCCISTSCQIFFSEQVPVVSVPIHMAPAWKKLRLTSRLYNSSYVEDIKRARGWRQKHQRHFEMKTNIWWELCPCSALWSTRIVKDYSRNGLTSTVESIVASTLGQWVWCCLGQTCIDGWESNNQTVIWKRSNTL